MPDINPRFEEVLRVIRGDPGITPAEIGRKLGIRSNNVKNIVCLLRKQEVVKPPDPTRWGQCYPAEVS